MVAVEIPLSLKWQKAAIFVSRWLFNQIWKFVLKLLKNSSESETSFANIV